MVIDFMNKRKTEKERSVGACALSGANTTYEEEPHDYTPLISHRNSKAKLDSVRTGSSPKTRPLY